MADTGDFYQACGEDADLDYVKKNLRSKTVRINKMVSKETCLFTAAQHGNAKIVEVLLTHNKIDVNKGILICSGWGSSGSEVFETPLFAACAKGSLDVVRLLLGHKNIDVNKGKGKKLNEKDENKTPLHAACEANFRKLVILLLLQKKIKTDIKFYGKTPNVSGSCKLDIKKLFVDYKISKSKFKKLYEKEIL